MFNDFTPALTNIYFPFINDMIIWQWIQFSNLFFYWISTFNTAVSLLNIPLLCFKTILLSMSDSISWISYLTSTIFKLGLFTWWTRPHLSGLSQASVLWRANRFYNIWLVWPILICDLEKSVISSLTFNNLRIHWLF